MIYVDSSVALATLLAKPHAPPTSFWDQPLTASRLLQYEVWNRIHARGVSQTRGDAIGALLDHVTMVELSPAVLERALEPFPVAVRTLDGLHLATIEFLRRRGHDIELASYDTRLVAAAGALGISVMRL